MANAVYFLGSTWKRMLATFKTKYLNGNGYQGVVSRQAAPAQGLQAAVQWLRGKMIMTNLGCGGRG